MTLDLQKYTVVSNGVPIPGVLRNGVFMTEQPLNTCLLFRSSSFTANQSKVFGIEFPCIPEEVIFNDANNNTQYTFTITTAEGSSYSMVYSGSNVVIYGNVKKLTFPKVVFDKGTKIGVQPSNAVTNFAMFAKLALNVDIKDF